MTISSNVRKVGPFTGTGTVTVFTFNFKVFQASDLYVVKADSDGIETVLELNTDYTVSLNGNQDSNPGGSITLASALASGYTMIISSTVGNLQPTDLTNQGGFYPSVITDALDRATIQIQQLQESVDRSAKLPITNDTDAAQLTADIVLLANNKDQLDTIADNINSVQTVADDLNGAHDIVTVAGAIDNVNAVGNNIANVNTVAGNTTNINTVAGNTANVTTVAGISGNVTTVADNINSVQTVADDLNGAHDIVTVAGAIDNVNAVGNNIANVNTVAGNTTNINAVNANKTNIDTVAGDKANIDAVAYDLTTINAVHANKANIDTVAGINPDVTAVAAVDDEVQTVADNLTSINSFFKVYLGAKSSDPATRNDGTALVDGDMYSNTSTTTMRFYASGAWHDTGITLNPSVQRFSGTGSQTAFTLSSSPGTVYALIVNISGVVQTPGADFTLSGTTLTFTTAPPSGTNNITVQNFGSAGVINVPATGSVTTESLAEGFIAPTATNASNVPWSGVSSKPTTLAGYGITDAQPSDTAITTSNIGSQSVSYASSAGNADTLDGNHASAFQAVLSTHIDQSALFSGSQTTLALPDISVMVGGTLVAITATNVNLATSGNWDSATYATAANRKGKDFYVYALQAGGFILSANSSYPTGYDSNNSRKIGGFHCLAVAVGTISGHTLSGYVAGDILPRSVWDRFNRSSARQEGTVLSSSGVWVDIYLPSVSGTTLVSVNGGTIADGPSSPAFHCYKFEQWFARQGMKLISQLEFFAASQGANQSTNISGSSDPGTTSGHTDTAGRRMISNEGIEDLCGVMWQWTRDQGGNMTAASSVNAYDGNDSGVGGQHYQATYRGLLGGGWFSGVICGSRGSAWAGSPLSLASSISSRGVAEPANSRF